MPPLAQVGTAVVVVVEVVVVVPQAALVVLQSLGRQTRQQPLAGSQRCPEGHCASAVQPVSTQAPAVCPQKAPPSVARLHVQPSDTQAFAWQTPRVPHSVASHIEIVVLVVFVVVAVVVVVLSQTVPAPHTREQQSKSERQPWSPSGMQATHIPVVVSQSDMAQVPQLPPQPSSPQFLPVQSGVQVVSPQLGGAGFVADLHAARSEFLSSLHAVRHAGRALPFGQARLQAVASCSISRKQTWPHRARAGEAVRPAVVSIARSATGSSERGDMRHPPWCMGHGASSRRGLGAS